MREAEHLRAVLDARGVALMSPVRITPVNLGDIIGFATVHIPRFVTWGGVGEILGFLDLPVLNGYSKQVHGPHRRHKNPAYLQNSHFVI
jgi:hypothetical protein